MSSAPRNLSSRSSGRKPSSASPRSHKLDSVTAAEARREARSARRKCSHCDQLISYTNLARHKREKGHDVGLVDEAPRSRSGNSCATCQKSYTRPGSLLRHYNSDGHKSFSSASAAEASMESILPISGSESDANSIASEANSTPAFTHAKLEMHEAATSSMYTAYTSGVSMPSQVDMGSQLVAHFVGSQEVETNLETDYHAHNASAIWDDFIHARGMPTTSPIAPLPRFPSTSELLLNGCPAASLIDNPNQTRNLTRGHGGAEVVEIGHVLSYRRNSHSDESMHSASYTPPWLLHSFSFSPHSPRSFQNRSD